MSDAQYHEDEEQYHDFRIRDANDDDSGPTYREMLARNAEEIDRSYSPFGRNDPRTTQITEEDEALLVLEAEAGYAAEELKARPELLPRVGMMVSYHGEGQHRIVETDKYDDDPGWVKLDNGQEVDFFHCCDWLFNQPCPTCGEPNGFHDDEKHRKAIDPKHLLKKGWHLAKTTT